MSLAAIRTKVRQHTDKVLNFDNTADIDPAVNTWYLSCWKKLALIRPDLAMATDPIALVAGTSSYTVSATDYLCPQFIQASATYIDGKKYVFAVQSREFYRYDDQAQPLVAQRAGTTLIFQPTPDVTMEVTLHYIRTPPTITTSVAEIIFGVDTLAFGGIAELYDSINFPDADGYHAKAQKFLQDDLNVLNTFGHNSGLMLTVSGFPYE